MMFSVLTLAPFSQVWLYAVALPGILIASALAATKLITTWNYHQALRKFEVARHSTPTIVRPPQIPYYLPWMGNALSFTQTPGETFWSQLFSWYPKSTGCLTLLLGGKKTHIVFSPTTVQALFRANTPTREIHEIELSEFVFAMTPNEARTCQKTKHMDAESNSRYLTPYERVNELTAKFTQLLDEQLKEETESLLSLDSVDLYGWLRDRMFSASCTAFFGQQLMEMYPSYCEDFFGFADDFIKFLFQLPSYMMKDATGRRKRIITRLEEWSSQMRRLCGGTPIDPESVDWEPYLGSRLNRARQRDYTARGLSTRNGAALDLGLTLGLSANAIPAAGWMLFHALDPKAPAGLLPRLVAEIKHSEKADHTLDIATLITQPTLQSLWQETLRMHVDVLVTRHLPEDFVLPLDEEGERKVAFQKGDHLFAGSWVGHHEPGNWPTDHAPTDVFDAERFIVADPKTGERMFNAGKTAGKLFPFGGGKTLCPGRFFAKQEAIGAVAMVLLRFDFEAKGFVDSQKRPTPSFPLAKHAFPGSGSQVPGGDMMVKIRRRQ